MICSEQLGIAEWCLDETVRYVSERIQFGRPVGSFQALKHRLADVWLGVVGARAASRNAADALARDADDAAIAVALAKAHCSNAAVKAAEECVQLHGGIGMTWEHPAHLYLKRAKFDSIAFGTPGPSVRRARRAGRPPGRRLSTFEGTSLHGLLVRRHHPRVPRPAPGVHGRADLPGRT